MRGGKRITSFVIPQGKVEDFVNDIDGNLLLGKVQIPQRYFWQLMMQYKSEGTWRRMMHAIDAKGFGINHYFYISYN